MTPHHHQRRALRRTALVIGCLAVGALVGATTYGVSLEPGAAIVRAAFEAKPEVTPPADFATIAAGVQRRPDVALHGPGIPDAALQVYEPVAAAAVPRALVLWIHGGGFISSSADTVADYAVMLAARGYVVASLDYTLAPQAQHPVPVLQANEAIAFLAAHAADYDADASRIVLGGDSAGAQIASETAAALTSPRLASQLRLTPAVPASSIRGVVLLCGLYDMATVASTGFPALRTYLWAYTGQRDWQRAPDIDALSTTSTATSAYPPTFLTVGNADPFESQGEELALALQRRGVDVTTLLWGDHSPALGHEYQFDFTTPEARAAFDATVRFLGEETGR